VNIYRTMYGLGFPHNGVWRGRIDLERIPDTFYQFHVPNYLGVRREIYCIRECFRLDAPLETLKPSSFTWLYRGKEMEAGSVGHSILVH
jgi:hypothetical protein